MKNRYSITAGLLACAGITLLVSSCNKSSKGDAPTVLTNTVFADVTPTSAQSGGVINSVGGSLITADGVCWSSTNQNPTIADSHSSDAISVYAFASNLTGLTANTTYYVRAYAQNDEGVSYGSVIKFTTSSGTADTTATVSAFAGNGTGSFANGSGASASFYHPQGIAADAQGNLYVADSFNHIIRKITAAGVVTTFAGSGTQGFVAGTATDAQFYSPYGVAVDASGNVYVSDEGDNAIFKITSAGVVSILAGTGTAGSADGAGNVARFNTPQGIAVDASGNVYVADRNNDRIRKITAAGVVSTLTGELAAGYLNSDVGTPYFNQPTGVAVDASGNVYVADQSNHAIRMVTASGTVSTLVGNTLQTTLLNTPTGIAVDGQGNLFITDETGRVMEITSQNILYTLAGTANNYNFADGINAGASFNSPRGIAVDASKNIYIADYNNHRIRKINVVTK